jgi:G3E family GTPase
MNRRLPVTLVGGFLGAGKTSLLHHFISEHRGGHLAVLVENPGALNLDAKALRGLCGAMRRLNDTVLEIPDGDEATQIEWIAARLREFSLAGRYERVLVEVGGTTNAARLARHFGLLPGQPETFSPWAELYQTVCVVDALDFFRISQAPVSEASLGDFQNEQIAGASLVILNKCDLIEDKERETCLGTLRALYPGIRIIETAYGEMPPEICSKRATPQELGLAVERRPQLKAVGATAPELASALYRVHRPFHPERFWDWFNANHPGLLRVKGLIWLATRNLLVGGVSRTRWQNSCGTAGIWWAALPREEWPQEPEALMRMQETWREPYGDRRQELILIGEAELLSTTMRRQLDDCLLTDEEYARPVKEWATLADPFPAWDLEDD